MAVASAITVKAIKIKRRSLVILLEINETSLVFRVDMDLVCRLTKRIDFSSAKNVKIWYLYN